jgi:hypothetical protein
MKNFIKFLVVILALGALAEPLMSMINDTPSKMRIKSRRGGEPGP